MDWIYTVEQNRLPLWFSWERNVRIEWRVWAAWYEHFWGKGKADAGSTFAQTLTIQYIICLLSCQHDDTLLHINCIYSQKVPRNHSILVSTKTLFHNDCKDGVCEEGGKWGLQAGQSLKVDLCICQILYPRLLCPRPACNSNKKWASESESYYLQEFTVYNQMYRRSVV